MFALGVMIGIYVGGKFCNWAISKYRKATYSTILGMLMEVQFLIRLNKSK